MKYPVRQPTWLATRSSAASFVPCKRRLSVAASSRTYNDAVKALNSLQSTAAAIEARRKAGVRPRESAIAEMRIYLKRIGYATSDLNKLNIIHVAGTKGKGSTCAFIDSILGQYRQNRTLQKTGLLISPHLISVRERIRINSKPISEDLFTKYFFDVWDRLGASTLEEGTLPLGQRPLYGRYLTLMSWHAFLQEGVDISVYETGVGGEFDASNVVEQPLATGITTLGIDHVFVLGHTIEEIAWHKAGIMKKGSPAFTVQQLAPAMEVLERRAREKGVSLRKLDLDPRLRDVVVRPDAEFQKLNASLAIALTEAALDQKGVKLQKDGPLPAAFVEGIQNTVFRGRCEIKDDDAVTWYLDGAHTANSLAVSSKWFADASSEAAGPRVLIFNQQSRTEAIEFLEPLFEASKREQPDATKALAFDHVIFCSNTTYADASYKLDLVDNQADTAEVDKMLVQQRFAEKWIAMDPKADVCVVKSIEEALGFAKGLSEGLAFGEKVHAYVTGSLHLVGGALGLIEKADAL